MRQENIDLITILTDVEDGQSRVANLITQTNDCEYRLVLMGETGVGKTTVGNYLTGISLEAFTGLDSKLHLRGGVGIGHQMRSETGVPNLFKSEDNSLAVVDCPGINDVNGLDQQIKNAFYVYSLFNGYASNPRLQNLHVAFVVRDSAIEVAGRGIGLHSSIKEAVRLVSNAHDAVKENFSLIVTGGSKTVESIKSALSEIKGHWDSVHSNEGLEACRERRQAAAFLGDLLDSGHERIFLFPEPTSVGENYVCDIRENLMDNLSRSNNNPLPILDVNIVVSDEVTTLILELANDLKENIINFQMEALAQYQKNFLDPIREVLESDQNISEERYRDYLQQCGEIKEGLNNFSLYIKKIEEFKRNQNAERCYRLFIQKDIEIIDKLKSFFSDSDLSDLEVFFLQANNNLCQLKCCGSIAIASLRVPLHYSRVTNSLHSIIENIEENFEIKLLDKLINIINDKFQRSMRKLIEEVKNYHENHSIKFEELIDYYKKMKSIKDRYSSDSNTGVHGIFRLKQFSKMIKEVFRSGFSIFPESVGSQTILERIDKRIEELSGIYTNYGNKINLVNVPNQAQYLSIFEKNMHVFISFYEEKLKKDVNSIVEKAKALLNNLHLSMKVEYEKRDDPESLVEIDRLVDRLREFYLFFDEVFKDFESNETILRAAEAGIERILKVNPRESEQHKAFALNLLHENQGLKRLTYLLHALLKINALKLENPIDIDAIAEELTAVFHWVFEGIIPVSILNVECVDFIVQEIKKEKDSCQNTYKSVCENFIETIVRSMPSEYFWSGFEACLHPSRCGNSKKEILRKRHLLWLRRPTGSDIRIIKHFHQQMIADNQDSLFDRDIEAVANLINFYNQGKNFLDKNSNDATLPHLEAFFSGKVKNFVRSFERSRTAFHNQGASIAEDFADSVQAKVDEFLSNLRNFSVSSPEKTKRLLSRVSYFLLRRYEKHNQDRENQLAAIRAIEEPPWVAITFFLFSFDRLRIRGLDVLPLERASELYRSHYEDCAKYSWLSNPRRFSAINTNFWESFSNLCEDFPPGKDYCSLFKMSNIYKTIIWKRIPPPSDETREIPLPLPPQERK